MLLQRWATTALLIDARQVVDERHADSGPLQELIGSASPSIKQAGVGFESARLFLLLYKSNWSR